MQRNCGWFVCSRVRPSAIALLVLAVLTTPAVACTIFAVSRDGVVLMGNSEDFTKRGAVWFVPGGEGRFGRVNVGFHSLFGKREDFAQGSMNERGLAFDAAVVVKVPWEADPNKETPDNLLEKIMNECSTVAEAVEYFERYNCEYLASSQFLLADAGGASAVVTWLPEKGLSVVQREQNADSLVATNTRLEPSGYRCQRWVRAMNELQTDGRSAFEAAREALHGIHQHGPAAFTSYSCIYDLKNRRLFLYNLANFDEVVELDLMAELQKGSPSYLMKKLFQHSPPLKELKSKPQRMEYATRVKVSRDDLVRLEGQYRPDIAPQITVRVEAVDGGLQVHNPGQPPAALFPESSTVFRLAPDRGQVRFHLASDGRVTGLTLHKGRDVHASRVAE